MNEWISVKDGLPTKEDSCNSIFIVYPPGKYSPVDVIFWAYESYGGHIKNTFEYEHDDGTIFQVDVEYYFKYQAPSEIKCQKEK